MSLNSDFGCGESWLLPGLSYGYYGVLCNDTSFVAISDRESISARSKEDYDLKYRRVKQDFIDPLLDGVIY